uniref:Uncharacterized protein n=1 Tax=Brassica oleracea var. oleracea TaxID=109376 RepID=A0A0D3BYZ2_BRAOL
METTPDKLTRSHLVTSISCSQFLQVNKTIIDKSFMSEDKTVPVTKDNHSQDTLTHHHLSTYSSPYLKPQASTKQYLNQNQTNDGNPVDRLQLIKVAHTNKTTGQIQDPVIKGVVDLVEAEIVYQSQPLSDDGDSMGASPNLSLLQINEMVEKAVPYHISSEYTDEHHSSVYFDDHCPSVYADAQSSSEYTEEHATSELSEERSPSETRHRHNRTGKRQQGDVTGVEGDEAETWPKWNETRRRPGQSYPGGGSPLRRCRQSHAGGGFI